MEPLLFSDKMLISLILYLMTVILTDAQTKPNDWAGKYNATDQKSRNTIGYWLLTGSTQNGLYPDRKVEYEGFDGWYNNIARPDLGAIDRPLLRRWPASYEDGTYSPAGSDRPNPFTLSEELLKGDVGIPSETGKSAFLVFFGQQVVEEILDAQRPACPPEYFNIEIPPEHVYRNQTMHTEMPFLRTRYDQRTGYNPNNPRQQLNEITPYIDGGLFYGITKQWSDQLRTNETGGIDPDGCLASSHGGLFPAYNSERLPMANPPPPHHHATYIKNHETAKISRFFKLGNPRGNENAFLLTFGVMWFRWHNYLAKIIREINPGWSSDKVFNEARKWVIATQQNLYVYQWLPLWLGESLPDYSRYDPSVDPQIDQFFQAAAFRFGHTLVVPGVYLRDYVRNQCKHRFTTWNRNAVRTCNIFWLPYEPMVTKASNDSEELIDIDRLLMGMAVQLAEKDDHTIIEDLRGNVFGPLEFPRRDLMAINIQRGRDHGLPDYNTAREIFNLPRLSFEQIQNTVGKEYADKLRTLYRNRIDNIDVWIGGIMETVNGPGDLFKSVIKDQFSRIRNGDRFWFENKLNKLFTQREIDRIKSITVYDIVMAVTKMDDDDIQRNPFRVPMENSSLVQACNLISPTGLQNGTTFYALPILNQVALNESCTLGTSYDYFQNSELSFIFTFICVGATILGAVGVGYVLINIKERERQALAIHENRITRNTFKAERKINYPIFVVFEWVGPNNPFRRVILVLKADKKKIEVLSETGEVFRVVELATFNKPVEIYQIIDALYVIVKCPHNYDLVVSFESDYLRSNFLTEFDTFVTSSGLQREHITSFNLKSALKKVVTKDDRQKLLETFYRVVFAQAFKIKHSKKEMLKVDSTVEKEISDIELTLSEFAESLSMRSNDEFVMRMFHLIDKDKNGFISFREFVSLLIIFAEGTEEQRAKLLFDMYDIDAVGYLTEENFHAMIKSFLATVGGQVDEGELQRTVKLMMDKVGAANKKKLYFEDFLRMCGDDVKNLSRAKLNFTGVREQDRGSYLQTARDTIENIYSSHRDIQERFQGEIGERSNDNATDSSNLIDEEQDRILKDKKKETPTRTYAFLRYLELKSCLIFWLTLYTLVLLAIFAERAYYYTVEREHSGLRRIAGYGVTITRGAASAMMFTYSSLLVTMCRNAITCLRDTVLNKFFPFDDSVAIHKYIAVWAFVFTVLHIIGHAFNFYHISTQTSDDLTCLFRNFFHATHEIPKFHYWCWQTITGFTGILLTIVWAVMYIFAQNIVRRKIYNWFWYTHNLYPLFYLLMILHGVGRLIQPPFFYYFFLGPVILFALDSLVSVSRKKVEIPVLKAEILPSNVLLLEFRKPENFQYKSGQWARIACLALNKNEYHPFTFSSAPDEKNLTFHIRAVGPWTSLIRNVYDNTNKTNSSLPKLYLDGPYGQGHQDWNLYDVAVLVGGGIGVTPFASILKDVVYRANQTRCKKVHFIWVSRTQKQFEWFVDIIREIEAKNKNLLISCHIFITQFFEKFDLRTIFLYICERHYQRVSNRSLFTNLRAVTHFGRPDFNKFFKTITTLHQSVHTIGVFSCGPPGMTNAVDAACNKLNINGTQKFEHHYKNF